MKIEGVKFRRCKIESTKIDNIKIKIKIKIKISQVRGRVRESKGELGRGRVRDS